MQQEARSSFIKFDGDQLGSLSFKPVDISRFEKLLDNTDFTAFSMFEKHKKASEIIFNFLLGVNGPCFLFRELIACISFVKSKILKRYCFSSFELWLNHYCLNSQEDKEIVRAKIVGKNLDRSDYQQFFPIGQGNTFKGSHFSVAHFSPDLDTTIASFWGFMDAFAARVCDSFHYWQLPGGRPKGVVELDLLFDRIFSSDFFDVVAKSSKSLELTSVDLMSQKGIKRCRVSDLSSSFEYDFSKTALLIVDDKGHYVGDWRSKDANTIRNLVMRFISLISAYEHSCTLFLIRLLAKKNASSITHELDLFLKRSLDDCAQGEDLTDKIKSRLQKLIVNFLGIEKGLKAPYQEFLEKTKIAKGKELLNCMKTCSKKLEDGQDVFVFLEELSLLQGQFFDEFKTYLDTLESGLKIKKSVFGIEAQAMSHIAHVDEIEANMNHYHHLSIAYEAEGQKSQSPLGVIWAEDLRQKVLATVSLRDFSNFDEMKMPDYMQVISCIDHHKTSVATQSVSRSVISDAQSSNTIIASMVFDLNDRVSNGGMTLKCVEKGFSQLETMKECSAKYRLQRRLILRKENLQKKSGKYVSYEREFIEYYHFMYAIFDDTDLLNKVTAFDVRVVLELLNRLKSLLLRQEVEVLDFDDIQDKSDFVALAQKRLLESSDLYSLYIVNDDEKKKFLEKQILDCIEGKSLTFFSDTKVQGKYASIGQFKLMSQIEPMFRENRSKIQAVFLEQSKKIYKQNSSINLFIFMISSIDSAKDIYEKSLKTPDYKDELWFYADLSDKRAKYNLLHFLKSFLSSKKMVEQDYTIECIGSNGSVFQEALNSIGQDTTIIEKDIDVSLFIIKIDCKSIRSRKADISVHLS